MSSTADRYKVIKLFIRQTGEHAGYHDGSYPSPNLGNAKRYASPGSIKRALMYHRFRETDNGFYVGREVDVEAREVEA